MAVFMSSVMRSLSVTGRARLSSCGRAAPPKSRDAALQVTLHRGGLLAFPLLGRLLVEFAATQFGQHAGLFAGTLEAPQGGSKYSFSRTRTLGIETSIDDLDQSTGRDPDGSRCREKGPRILESADGNCKACESWASKPPATRPPPPSTTARPGLLAHEVYSQVDLHAAYGGVVPELASRDHVRKLLPLLKKVLEPSRRTGGASTASPTPPGRAWSARCWSGPRWPAAWPMPGACRRSASTTWRATCWRRCSSPTRRAFPFVALLVSGGHTLLLEVAGVGRYRILGSSLTTRPARPSTRPPSCSGCLPGRPAARARSPSAAGPGAFRFPRPMTDRPGLDFSFSGLKTRGGRARCAAAALDDQTPRRRRARASRRRSSIRWSIKCRCARSSRPTRARWSWPAASAPTAGCGRELAMGERAGRARRLSARRILHRQRRDDRAARPPAARGRRARRPRDPRPRPLADGRARPPSGTRHALRSGIAPFMMPCHSATAASPMDMIFLTGLTIECIIGIWDWERRVKQKVVIDLEMAADIRRAAAQRRDRRHARLQARREAPARVRRRVAVPAGRDAGRAHRRARGHRVRRAVGAGAAQQAGRDPRLARRRHPDRAHAREDYASAAGGRAVTAGATSRPAATSSRSRTCAARSTSCAAHYPALRCSPRLPQSRASASRATIS